MNPWVEVMEKINADGVIFLDMVDFYNKNFSKFKCRLSKREITDRKVVPILPYVFYRYDRKTHEIIYMNQEGRILNGNT